MNCRHCQKKLKYTFLDLGFAPPSNAYLSEDDLKCPELYFPLKIRVCDNCWLVQTEDYASAEDLFSPDYSYFSSTANSWVKHAEEFSEKIITQLGLTHESFVIEVGSNDGYLLRNFVRASIPCLGIEPTVGPSEAARKLGVPVLQEFFNEDVGKRLAEQNKQADLVAANNVYAHVPDINDFTKGLKAILKPSGTVTLEFPHLMCLIEKVQFDTVYHEHFSYLSLYTVCRIFSTVGLRVWKVVELFTHGGSLRVYGCHDEDPRPTHRSVNAVLSAEEDYGLQKLQSYNQFQALVDKIKYDFLNFLIKQKRNGKIVAAYGAAAKGNTLLNYAGIRQDLLPFVCDASAAKQGKFLPGSHLPILPPEKLWENMPDYILILPWNIAAEVTEQLRDLAEQGTIFFSAFADLQNLDLIKTVDKC